MNYTVYWRAWSWKTKRVVQDMLVWTDDPVKCEVLLILVGKCFSTGQHNIIPEAGRKKDFFKCAISSILTVINDYSNVESLAELQHQLPASVPGLVWFWWKVHYKDGFKHKMRRGYFSSRAKWAAESQLSYEVRFDKRIILSMFILISKAEDKSHRNHRITYSSPPKLL